MESLFSFYYNCTLYWICFLVLSYQLTTQDLANGRLRQFIAELDSEWGLCRRPVVPCRRL